MSQAALGREVKRRLLLIAGRTYLNGSLEFSWLLDLVQQHPEAREKLQDVVGIEVARRDRGALVYPELWLHLDGGGVRDCSWRACVRGPSSREARRFAALRWAVRDHIDAARREWAAWRRDAHDGRSTVTCGVCGDVIDAGEPLHVDHSGLPFVMLARRFLAMYDDGSPALNLRALPIGGYELADPQTVAAWRALHDSTALLMPTHALCNLRKGARGNGDARDEAHPTTAGR